MHTPLPLSLVSSLWLRISLVLLCIALFPPLLASAQSLTCIDSDGGKVYDKQGFVGQKSDGEYLVKKADSCDGNILAEQYCSGASLVEIAYTCPYGCGDGACRPAPTFNAADIAAASARRRLRLESRVGTDPRARTQSSGAYTGYLYQTPHAGVLRRLPFASPQPTTGPPLRKAGTPSRVDLQKKRVCARILRRFAGKATLIERINRRIARRFGFMCSMEE